MTPHTCHSPFSEECSVGTPDEQERYESALLQEQLERSILKGLDRCPDCGSEDWTEECPFCGSTAIDTDTQICPRCREHAIAVLRCADCGELKEDT